MFVHSLFKEDIVYRVRGKKYIIKPGMNNLTGVTKEELVRTFGNIDLVFVEGNTVEATEATEETPTEVIAESVEEVKAEVAEVEETAPVEEVKTEVAEVEETAPVADVVQEEITPDKEEGEEAPKTEEAVKAPTKSAKKATGKKANK